MWGRRLHSQWCINHLTILLRAIINKIENIPDPYIISCKFFFGGMYHMIYENISKQASLDLSKLYIYSSFCSPINTLYLTKLQYFSLIFSWFRTLRHFLKKARNCRSYLAFVWRAVVVTCWPAVLWEKTSTFINRMDLQRRLEKISSYIVIIRRFIYLE